MDKPQIPDERYAFVLAGLPGAGKTTAAEILVDELEHNFEVASHEEVSDFCRYLYENEHGEAPPNDNELGRWTAELKEEHGRDYIVSEMARCLHGSYDCHVVISGVRSPEEADAVADIFDNVVVVGIHTRASLRFERKYDEPYVEDSDHWNEFQERDRREKHEWGCKEFFVAEGRADYIVSNNTTIGNLESQLSTIIGHEVKGRTSQRARLLATSPFGRMPDEEVTRRL